MPGFSGNSGRSQTHGCVGCAAVRVPVSAQIRLEAGTVCSVEPYSFSPSPMLGRCILHGHGGFQPQTLPESFASARFRNCSSRAVRWKSVVPHKGLSLVLHYSPFLFPAPFSEYLYATFLRTTATFLQITATEKQGCRFLRTLGLTFQPGCAHRLSLTFPTCSRKCFSTLHLLLSSLLPTPCKSLPPQACERQDYAVSPYQSSVK